MKLDDSGKVKWSELFSGVFKLGEGFENVVFGASDSDTRGFMFLEVESKVGVGDMVGLWTSE